VEYDLASQYFGLHDYRSMATKSAPLAVHADDSPKISVVELFAGVGGFREALQLGGNDSVYKVVWSNQWEPAESKKPGDAQVANRVYLEKFKNDGVRHSTIDIDEVTEGAESIKQIPKGVQMVVGGFPCQDYSVAKPRNASKGIMGPKGTLWWNIYKILAERDPALVLLENVDLLVKSPSEARGRDFAIILKSLYELGYSVEWRVINAADYGYVQRRRRVYIFAYKPKQPRKNSGDSNWLKGIVKSKGFFSSRFKVEEPKDFVSYRVPPKINVEDFKKVACKGETISPFKAAGAMHNGLCVSADYKPVLSGKRQKLRDKLLSADELRTISNIDDFRIRDQSVIDQWAYVKGRKNELRRKLQPVERLIKKRLPRTASTSTTEYAKALKSEARALIENLQLDALVSVKHGESHTLLTREEVNIHVRDILRDSLKHKKVIGFREIYFVLNDTALRERLLYVLTSALKGRSISPAALSRLTCKRFSNLEAAVRGLSAPGIEATVSIAKRTEKFTRDEVSNLGIVYRYQEGAMLFPDSLDAASRTVITSEGGPSVSRFKHVICEQCAAGVKPHDSPIECIKGGRLRRLLPIEIERLNNFSDKHSQVCEELGISAGKRVMLMGNAVVVDLLRDMFAHLPDWLSKSGISVKS
jgi:DNA (cytosine-5)-methyltransferase 1